MLTRIEIDGFKTFENFKLDLRPLTAIVGPNASGKSNLFDALRFLSLLAQSDIRSAMLGLRGEPEELFRHTAAGDATRMSFAVEVVLDPKGVDAFGQAYEISAQRLRYELALELVKDRDGTPKGIFVRHERCSRIETGKETADYIKELKLHYGARVNPFIEVEDSAGVISIRQDGPKKRGRPMQLSLKEASRTALSTITSAEFPHLYALRDVMAGIKFLEINPRAARAANDRFEDRELRSDASNLAAVLAHLKEETATPERPDGVLADIAADLTSLIPSVRRLNIRNDASERQYSFGLEFAGDLSFSARVISDGTLRLLALLTRLDDPKRRGTLCFEEPENGVHEGRLPNLVKFLREAAALPSDPSDGFFQVLLNTHSPKVMAELNDPEIVAADTVLHVDPGTGTRAARTRMRTGVSSQGDILDPERHLSRAEVDRLLRHATDAA